MSFPSFLHFKGVSNHGEFRQGTCPPLAVQAGVEAGVRFAGSMAQREGHRKATQLGSKKIYDFFSSKESTFSSKKYNCTRAKVAINHIFFFNY